MELRLFIKASLAILFIVVVIVIFSLAELYSQLSRYQNYWDRNNDRSLDSTARLYVALGDSTAQGIGAGSPDKGYVGLIEKDLATKSGSAPIQTINLSKSGARVSDVLTTQIPELRKLPLSQSTVITISVGANDISNFDPQRFEKDVDQLMSELPKQTVMGDIPYFGGSRYSNREPLVLEANQIMHRLAAKHGFELVPLHKDIQENSSFRNFAADRFHPSSSAYRTIWAPAFLSGLESRL